MWIKSIFVLSLITNSDFSQASEKSNSYDCSAPRPEMAGFHNMVLFGDSKDKLYSYHLPLFKGKVNGKAGHVSMHIYQGLWEVELDKETTLKYEDKFKEHVSEENPFPFFSISPRGERFKVPEMICNKDFKTKVLSAYGHVEANPSFPAPEPLLSKLSELEAKKVLFARRFDGSAKKELTYILFGSKKNLFMAHFLTDDENSFDQIVAVKIENQSLKDKVEKDGPILLTISDKLNGNLEKIEGSNSLKSKNNSYFLPVTPNGQEVQGSFEGTNYKFQIIGEIYFNNNNDLKV